MTFSIEIVLAIIGQVAAAGAIYGAIRADIKGIHTRLGDLREESKRIDEAVTRAHERIDAIQNSPR